MNNRVLLTLYICICVAESFDPFIRCFIDSDNLEQLIICAIHMYVILLLIPTIFSKNYLIVIVAIINGMMTFVDTAHMISINRGKATNWVYLFLHYIPIFISVAIAAKYAKNSEMEEMEI